MHRLLRPCAVTPHAKQRSVQPAADGTLLVQVVEPAKGGRANAAVIAALAAHVGVPKRCVTMLRGLTGRQKLIEVITEG